jgi:hypothetical protein
MRPLVQPLVLSPAPQERKKEIVEGYTRNKYGTVTEQVK